MIEYLKKYLSEVELKITYEKEVCFKMTINEHFVPLAEIRE